MSNRAQSSLFADLRMSCSPERGWWLNYNIVSLSSLWRIDGNPPRAPSSLFADLRMSCSPERGWWLNYNIVSLSSLWRIDGNPPRAPSSLFADLRMSCSPERGWSGGSITTLCLLAHCGELMGIHPGSRLVHAQLYSCGHR